MFLATAWEDFHLNGLLNNYHIGIAKIVDVRSQRPEVKCVNAGFLQLINYPLHDLENREYWDFYQFISQKECAGLKKVYRNQFHPGRNYSITYQLITKEGERVWVVDNGYFYVDEAGKECAQIILTPITELKRAEQENTEIRKRLRAGLKSSGTCVFEVDLVHQLYTHFENAEDIFGVSGQKILQEVQQLSSLSKEKYQAAASAYFSHPDDTAVIANAFAQINRGEPTTYVARMKAGDTKFIWCKIDATPFLHDGVPVRMVGVITNIDHIKVETERLKQQATRDMFTGLLNKKSAQRAIENILSTEKEARYALLVLDMDNLKQINDTYGHNAGDDAIRGVATQLTEVFNDDDIIGRFGGDEFVIFVKYHQHCDEVLSKVRRLLNIERDVLVTASIGISFYPQHGSDFKTLFQRADIALYRAKNRRGTCEIYKQEKQGDERGG